MYTFCLTPVTHGLLGLNNTLPGTSGVNVPSMCIAFLSWKSNRWKRYPGNCRDIHCTPNSFVTCDRWQKMSNPIRVKSAASNIGSNSVVQYVTACLPFGSTQFRSYDWSLICALGAAIQFPPARKYSLHSDLNYLYSKNLLRHAIGASTIVFPMVMRTSLGIAA